MVSVSGMVKDWQLRLLFVMATGVLIFAAATAVPAGASAAADPDSAFASWQVLSEGRDEALYQLSLGGSVVEGLELRWYATGSGGDYNSDYVKIKLYDALGQLVGYFQYGRSGDNRDSVTGWHVAYMILPQRAAVNRVLLVLHQPGGSPRLATSFSWAKTWEAIVDTQYYPLSCEGQVSWSGYEALPRGKAWLHAAGLGTIWGWGAPQRATIDYVVWKSFAKPLPPSGFDTLPDIYVDAAYAGTVNVIGEGWTGQGGYAIAVQAGVGQGSWISDALSWGRKQCLWKAVSNTPEGYIQDVMQNEASGITDILIDALDVPWMGYVKFVLECAQLIYTLFDIDEKVAEAQTVVFESVPLQSNNRIYAWTRLKGVVAALGFAHSVASFSTDGTIEANLNGNRGIEVGGILLHYRGPSSPEVIETIPQYGAVGLPLRPELKVTFSRNIVLNNQANVVLRKAGATQAISCTVTAAGNTLTVKPNQDLEGNAAYELEIKPGAVGVQGSSCLNLASSTLRFSTGAPFVVTGASPPDAAANVPLKPTAIFVFNKPIAGKGSAYNSIALKNASGQVVARVGQGANCTISNTQISLTLSSPLAAGQQYTWEIPQDAFRDASGNPNRPAKFTFTTAPLVQVVAANPKNNDADVPVNQPITVCFSRPVVQGANYNGITLKTGSTNVAASKTVSGNMLVVQPSSPLAYNKTYVLTIPGGAVKDPATDAPSAADTLSFASAVPPAVVSTTPANNVTGVYRDQAIVLAFSELIKEGSAFSGIAVKAGSTALPYTATIEAYNLILTPRSSLPANTRITVSIPAGAVVDLKGTANQSSYTFSFTTGTDGIPPQVAWISPADGETGVSLNPVVYVHFSKNVQPGPNWGNITLKTEAGQVVGVNAVISSGNQLELRPTGQLRKNTVYVVTLPPGCVKEELGSPCDGPVLFQFRTAWQSDSNQAQ